ncbi:MAG TPA: fatty acyl-AMP ligase [Pseudomonadales bacterium]|nr:fatty acyl-AMP ligase [Pseudomonadales bacterium]
MSASPTHRPEPTPAPTDRVVPLRPGDFPTLLDALDYAATAGTGTSFHDGRGRLHQTLSWGELRARAERAGRHLAALGLPRASTVGIIAETHPDFIAAFFACRFAALTPVPLPASIHMGGHRHFVDMIGRLLTNAGAAVCLAGDEFIDYIRELDDACAPVFRGTLEELAGGPAAELPERPAVDELAYIQYTSGSTRFPRGAMLTEQATLRNVVGIIRDGLAIGPGDRFCSWLPMYHDMGLVGKMIVPMASQTSIDYLGTREFAMRPRMWPRLITDRAATISFAPPFGYELTARRLRAGDAEQFDLKSWRVAGCGADMIRPEILERFAEALAPGGFDAGALMPSYGMAEVSLAVSFTPRGNGVCADSIDNVLSQTSDEARPADASDPHASRFTRCGVPMPGYEVQIRGEQDEPLGERHVGGVFLRTPSTMLGYFGEAQINAQILRDGWLDTGDLGYMADGEVVITGRRKDLMIINGRNIWPQDIELIAEQFQGVRSGDAAAFTVDAEDGNPALVLLLQCREQDEETRDHLLRGIRSEIQAEFGIDPRVTPVPPHSLPRTTSGKLSRSRARNAFLEGIGAED